MYSQSDFHNPENVVWTVSELNDRVSQTLFTNFPPLWVAGEVRGFTRAASGHWYFTLKDATGELEKALKPPRVNVLLGGTSSEREISLLSLLLAGF